MPQPIRQTIGFDQVSLDRLRDFATKAGVSQRDVVCALLSQDEMHVCNIVRQFVADEQSVKALNRKKLVEASRAKNRELADVKKILAQMTADELSTFRATAFK